MYMSSVVPLYQRNHLKIHVGYGDTDTQPNADFLHRSCNSNLGSISSSLRCQAAFLHGKQQTELAEQLRIKRN